MTGIKITELVGKETVHTIGSGLGYHTMTQELAAAKLTELLLKQKDQDILCDITTQDNQDETLKQVPLKDVLSSIEGQIGYAVTQIQELFSDEYSAAQETSTVYRDTKRHSKAA